MSGDIEAGYCDICKIYSKSLLRKYYHYVIYCECCGSNHFELIRYCIMCKDEVKPPETINVVIKPID